MDDVTFEKLSDALDFVTKKHEALQDQAKDFNRSFAELTGGFHAGQQVTALDVVKICFALYGDPKKE